MTISVPSSTLTRQFTGLVGLYELRRVHVVVADSVAREPYPLPEGATRCALWDAQSFSLSSSAHTTGPDMPGIRNGFFAVVRRPWRPGVDVDH